MAKRSTLDDQLDALSAVMNDASSPASQKHLRKALDSRHNTVVAKAARIAAGNNLRELLPDLVNAFHRFMEDAIKRDRGCEAKRAIVEALDRMDSEEDAPYRVGARHVQLEPSYSGPPEFGGAIDVAAPLRPRCVAALARRYDPEVPNLLADLLFDDWPEARRGAISTAVFVGTDAAVLLLRCKARAGDEDPTIVGDCLQGLIRLDPKASLAFVGSFLEHRNEDLVEQAALALGESGQEDALPLLTDLWRREPKNEARERLILPIALLRTDTAFAFLVDVIEDGPLPLARRACEILRPQARSEPWLSRISEAAEDRRL